MNMTQMEKKKRRTAVEKERKELLTLLLKKAKMTQKDVVDSALETWVAMNLDLLTDSEKKRFKNLVF